MFGLLRGKRERLRRKASDWLARLQGPATEADRAAFRRWYDADAEHARAFQRAAASQGVGDILTGTEFARAQTLPPPLPQPFAFRPYAMAAGVAALLVVSGMVILGRPEIFMPPAQAETLFYATNVGEIRAVTLADGTRMTLDTKTEVTVEIGPEVRRVTLREGRARFAVAGADSRPFTVAAGTSRVTDGIGTFDVALRDGEAVIQPLQGTIAVQSAGHVSGAGPMRLATGQTAIISSRGGGVQARQLDRSQELWPSGRLDFNGTPLDRAVSEANRYGAGRIELGQRSLSSLRVTGTFKAGDLEGLARTLEAAFDLRLERGPNGHFILHPRPSAREATKQ